MGQMNIYEGSDDLEKDHSESCSNWIKRAVYITTIIIAGVLAIICLVFLVRWIFYSSM